jgi:hypothetical protein
MGIAGGEVVEVDSVEMHLYLMWWAGGMKIGTPAVRA